MLSALRFRPERVVGIPVALAILRFAFVIPSAVFSDGFLYRMIFIRNLPSASNDQKYGGYRNGLLYILSTIRTNIDASFVEFLAASAICISVSFRFIILHGVSH